MRIFTLITGATGGLGRAYCFECASRGYDLFLTATKDERLKALSIELKEQYPDIDVKYKKCNLNSDSERLEFVEYLKQNDFVIERFIANAGLDFEGPVLEKQTEDLLTVIKINVEATIHLAHFVVMQRDFNRKLYLLIVSSLAGYYSMPQKAIYASSKAMLTNFFTALHEELKDENVNVSIVCPGGMPTTQEMVNSIKSQGLSGKLSSTPMTVVAKNSLNVCDKNKLIYIPGWYNRFLKFISQLFTRKFVARQINRRWLKTREKAKHIASEGD